MKQLNEYIIHEELRNEIIERLYYHTRVEFKLGHYLYPFILEKYGKFDNAGLVLGHIINSLNASYQSQIIDCSQYNVFFKKIDIYIEETVDVYAAYDKLKNDTLYIELFCEKEIYEDNTDAIMKLILHELLHAYEDFNRINNTGKSIYDYWNHKYEQSFQNLNSLSIIKRSLSQCNYFLNDQERNAYFSQLEDDIKEIFKKHHISIENFDYSKFKEILKKTSIWETYFSLKDFILKIENSTTDNEFRKQVESIWDNLYDEELSYNIIKKDLLHNWKKFEKKFEQLVPKLICDYIETNLKEVAFDISKLDKEKYWETII